MYWLLRANAGTLALLWLVKSVMSAVLTLTGISAAIAVAYIALASGDSKNKRTQQPSDDAVDDAGDDPLEEARRIMRKYDGRE